MKSLYCFKVEEDYSITTYEITEYTEHYNYSKTRVWYKWETPRVNKSERHFQICGDKLDKFTCNKVYSFNPDVGRIKKIIFNSMTERIYRAKKELKKWDNKRDQFYLKNMLEI
jgi:hypothetical protein